MASIIPKQMFQFTLAIFLAFNLVNGQNAPSGANGKCPPGGLPDSASWVAQAKCTAPTLLDCTKPCGQSNTATPAPGSGSEASTSAAGGEGAASTVVVEESTNADGLVTEASSDSTGSASEAVTENASGQSQSTVSLTTPEGQQCVCTCEAGSSTPASSVLTSTLAASSSPSAEESAATGSQTSGGESGSTANGQETTTTTAGSSDLATTASTSGNSSSNCQCSVLYEELVRIRDSCGLNDTEKQWYNEFLVEIEEVLVDVTISVEVKLVKIGLCVERFFANYVSIREKCAFFQISTWGDFYGLVIIGKCYQADLQDSELEVIDESNGDSNFTQCLANQTASDVPSGISSVVQEFVKKIRKVCLRWKYAQWNFSKKLAWLYLVVEKILCEKYSDYSESIKSVKLNYGLTVRDLLSLTRHYYQQSVVVEEVFSGSSSNCALIVSLKQALAECTNVTIQTEGNTWVSQLETQFQQVSDVYQRVTIVTSSFSSSPLSDGCRAVLKGSKIVNVAMNLIFADVISIINACSNGYACGNLTTSNGPGETYEETCYVDAKNKSTMVEAVDDYYYSLKGVNQSQLSSTRLSIKNCVYNKFPNDQLKAKLNCSMGYIRQHLSNCGGCPRRQAWLAVELVTTVVVQGFGSAISALLGTLGSGCGCS